MHTKTALVTGGNKGIGFEVARQIGKAGYTVLLGARDPGRGEQAAAKLREEGLDVRFIALDIDTPASIVTAAQQIAGEFAHLDILVNNAGIAHRSDAGPDQVPLAALEQTMHTNFMGAVLVTQALLPLLRMAPAASIVNVSSGLGSLTLQGDLNYSHVDVKFLAYSASKAALNMLTVKLAYQLRATKIKVNSADPGYTATDLNGNRGYQTVPEGAAETIRLALLGEDGPSGTYSDAAGIVPW